MTQAQKAILAAQYVVLDADGTLFDVMDGYAEYFGGLLEAKYDCNKEMAIALYLSTAGTTVDKQFEAALNEQVVQFEPSDIDQLVEEIFELIRTQTEANPFDDVSLFFKWLEANNKILFLTSGSPTDALVSRLKKLGLFDRFVSVMGSDIVLKSEEHIKMFAKQIDVSYQDFANNACMIGDGPHDMEIARESGIPAIGLVRKQEDATSQAEKMVGAGANHIIQSLEELMST